jgi:PAS domain S-box-containing protein
MGRIARGTSVPLKPESCATSGATGDARDSSSSRARSTLHLPSRLIAGLVTGSTGCLVRIAAHPWGASLCLAGGYVILCGLYIVLSGRLAANAAGSVEQMHHLELWKGLVFIVATGLAYFGFSFSLLKRISTQQRQLALIFQGVSDGIFLIQIHADGRLRFLNVNAAFLKTIGLVREQVIDKSVGEIFPETDHVLAKGKYEEAIRDRKTVSWEESIRRPDGRRVREITVTPLTDKTGAVVQLTGVVRDITERKLADERLRECYRRLQVVSRRLVEVQEGERRHIARELHDEMGQTLTVAQLNLQAALQSPEARLLLPQLQASAEAVERVLEQVHDISLNLRPSMLDDLGLEPTLRWYTDRQAALTGMQAEFHAKPLEQRLDPMIETECFRIAQEALTNVVRHAQAHKVTVELSGENGQLHLRVRDDGIGFEVDPGREKAAMGESLGLLSMEERAALAGGELEYKSVPGRGTEVHAWFPLKWRDAAVVN